MATIKDNKLPEIKKLYKLGYSANDIAKKLGVSIDAVYYFFRKHDIPRRGPKENIAIQFERKAPSFKVKENLNKEEQLLKQSGVMLYWGEGSQWPGEKIVDFANSNTQMIKIFLEFLRKICGINEKKLRAYLYCYSNQNPEELIKYWSKITNIPQKQFTKPYVRQMYNESKTGKMKYGLIHIRYNDKKLLLLIKKWISEYSEKY